MKKQLVVLAAGMGSRYGGLKQMDPVGPSGEFILDYSVHDAMLAGFSEIVFVIRRDIEEDFKRIVGNRWESRVSVRYAYQELDDLPEGFTVPAERTKPWGTGHAVLAARKIIDSPFAMVNADDFYGRDSLSAITQFFNKTAEAPTAHAMVAYRLSQTLSEHGSVSRGICSVNDEGRLTRVVEYTTIQRGDDGLIRQGDEVLAEDTPCSMNLYGFKPAFIKFLSSGLVDFLRESGQEARSEYYITKVAGDLVERGEGSLDVLRTNSLWFGVTNAADRPKVVARLESLAEQGHYPRNLFAE